MNMYIVNGNLIAMSNELVGEVLDMIFISLYKSVIVA